MPSRETTEMLEAMAVALARYQHERDRLQAQPDRPKPADQANMRKILDQLEAHPGGLTRAAVLADLGWDNNHRAGRTAWNHLKTMKLITDRTPFQATPAGEDWYPDDEEPPE